MDSREERQKQADAAFRSSGFGMPKIAPSPIQQEADAAASLVNAKPVAPPPTLWEQVRDSEIGRSYFWGKEDYSRRAKEIADRLQVSPDVVSIAGEESLKRWENTFQTLEMGKRDDEFAQTWSDWNDISQTERAIRVHNYSDVKQTMGVVDNITSGIRQMDAQIKLSAMGNERMELEAQGKNTDELDAKIQNLQKYIMSQSGDGGVIHDTAGNLYMQANMALNSGKEALTGALMGAATGAAAGAAVSAPFGGVGALPGARAGFIQGARLGLQMGMFNRMNEMERGTDYLQYRSGGKYGKMSADTAAKAATAVGVANAVIEFASFRMGVKALGMGVNKIAGRATATGAQSIIRNAARSIASARSVGEATKIFAKSAGLGVASETSEEVMQQATQDIAWNVAADPSEGTRKMPVTEIISNAVDAGITAAPAILGMSAVLGTGANIRFVSKAARMLRPDYEIQKEMAVHTVGAQMLRDLETDKRTSALFKKDPELYTKSVQEAADKQGLGAFFVDANALMETEGGRDILNRMVSGNVVSEQALQTAIETEGRLEIPVGVYLQEDFTEQERAAVDKASAWTQDGTTQAEMAAHWENMAASKYAQELQDDIDRMIHATDRVLSDKFSAADEADKETIRQVLMANPLDLESARKKVRKEIADNIEQTFSDTISVMRTDLADGEIQLVPGRDTVYDQDRMLRASSNPQWYKDFYATHKRRPRIDEFYDIMLDEEEKQVQRYYSNGVIKSEQDYEDALQQIENGRKMVESLRTIDAYKDTFDELQKEKAVSLRMYLSPDEMKVYDDVKAYMDSVGGDAQESAHQAAYLWAKRAKVFTQMMHDMGHTDFVATDYLDMHPLFAMNEYTPDAADKMAAQLMQRNGGIAPREYFQNRYGDGGYDGKSMSNRARAAYDLGEKPMSKWTKDEIIEAILDYLDETEAATAISVDEIKALPAWLLRQEFLTYRSWHHTGALYNVTDFYGLDFKALDLPLAHYQEKIEEHKKELAATKGDREKERQQREARRERREFETRIKELRKYTKYKTDKGLIAAVDDGRVTLEELEQKEQEEKAKGYLRYTDYKTEKALIKALRNGDITMDKLETLRDEKDPKRIAARKLAKAQGKKEWLEVVGNDPALFRLLPEQARNDKDVALLAVHRYGLGALEYVGETLKNDPDFIVGAIRRNHGVLSQFTPALLENNFALLRRVVVVAPRTAGQIHNILSEKGRLEFITDVAKDAPAAVASFLSKERGLSPEEVERIFQASPKAAELVAKDDINHYKKDARGYMERYQAVAREFLKTESRIEYFQTAWHGSHHSFGWFDTNAIGTGTGRQAHGWGLYFTQSQGAARQYRDQLVSRESVRRGKTDGSYGQYLIFENGKPIDAAAQEAINRRIAAKTLKTVANGRPEETYFLPELKQVMQQLKEGDASTNRLIHVLREQIDTIKSNNKMSITAFLRQVPTDEKARIRAIVREAKAAANNEGRRTTIADVLEGVERHAKPLISQRERELADWRALSGLKVNALTVAAPGSLYKVDIPENEVLLDEDKPLNEQSETVRKAIAAYYQSRPDSYIAVPADGLGASTGEYFLRDVVFQMQREGEENPKKAASLLLHKFGIEGITYKEYKDGRCFVIFNDQAVRVLERNGQAVGEMYQDGKKVLLHSQSPLTRHVRGMTALRDGRQMLFLFRKDANFSTFVHESGHVFLEDLQQMAAQENAPEWLKKDWQTVKEWTGWKDGADNRTAHEKWARGFEAYVREGNAPSRDLKAVFRRFRRWLVGIYQNLLDLGEIPPESIRNVMDRMLATQEEIDAYTAEKALDTMQDVDTKLAARLAKLKARAAEKVEKDVEAKIRKGVEEVLEDAIQSWRTARTEELQKEEIYKHEALAKQFGEDVLNKYYADAAAFKKALEDAGGPLEERLKREEQEQRKAFTDELMNPESIRAQVEEYMTGELGQADLLEAETRYIARERNKLAGEYMKQLRKLNDNPQRGNPKRRLHPGELPESPTREELLAKPDVQVVDVALPENSPLVPSAELLAAQQARDEAYAAGKRGKALPDNPYWKEYRAQAKAWLKEHVPEHVAHPELGLIQIPRKGIDHATASARSAEALAVLGNLEQILANGVLTQYQTDRHGDGRVHGVWIMHTPVYYQGQTLVVRSVLKKRSDGAFYYDSQATKIEATIGLKPAGEYNSSVTDTSIVASSAISVEEMLKHVKSEDQPLADGYLTEAERLAEVLSYLRSELKGHEGARESVVDAQKQLSKIRQNERAAERELEREQALVKQLKENHAEDAEEHAQKLAEMRQKLTEMRKENAAKVQAIKKTAREEINTRLQGLRDVRDSTQGRLRLIEEQAAQTLRQAPIGESLTWKTYQRKIAYYGTLSSKALVRGDYAQAAEMKERQLYHAYLAKHAVMQEQQVDKDIRRLRENLKRMTRSQQPIRLDTQARYFVHHLMYQLGLTGTDAQAPIDGFEWSSIEELLNPDVAFGMGGDPVISPALRAMFEADGRNEKTWRQMPFETWEQTVQVLQAVYTAGRRMHDGLAIVRKNGERVSIADAANELALKLKKRYGEDNRDLRQIRNDMTRADRMGQLAGELVTQLIKPEIIMNRLDGRAVGVKIDDDSFHRFIYDPIARAANRKREMTADAKRTLSLIFERRYSRNEMRTMRQERKYQVGNRRAYTKEEILTAALNWGAAENRKRVLHTFGVDEMTMDVAFGEILTAKDWDTVEKIWQFIDGYYEERSRVLERETGVPLGKVEAVPFTINGRKFDGGYYPIVYDPQLSQRASDMDVANELAKQMSSNAVFGAGLGATKKRQAVVNRELLLSLDVLPRAVNEAILHISMREAVLDVAHLLDHAALAEPLQKVIGQSQYRMLREWVRDTWREELVRESSAEQFANLLRRNSTFAVMAYRTSTALLNICNIAMVAHSLGKVRTLQALLTFYRHPQRITRMVKEKSSFIAEREENLDRDLARDMKVSGKELSYVGTDGVAAKAAEGAYSAKEAVDRFGYWVITKTDLMFSLPTWQAVYEDTVRAEMERGELTAEQIDAEAIAKADEAVRRIWGSGEIQDQSKVQKGRIMKFFTPFYTFFSVVLNAHIEAGYALKDNGNPVPLMSTVLYWLFLQALLETALRGAIDAATGRGPDDDDDWVEYFGKEYLKNFVGTATGGIPGLNIAATLTMNTMLGEYYQGRGSQVVALRVMDELQDLVYAVGSDKRDWIDMGRSASRVGNRLVGFSDTLTDGFWTLLRVTCTESDATWDEAVADIIFDRKAGKAK
nr:MAG TPA: crystallin beta/gamma motif-containing protein [Caudoviricetes sp.]